MAAKPNRPSGDIDVGDAWRRFKDRLHAFALRRLGSTVEAEDVVQDVMMRLLQQRGRVESDRLAAWIFTTARNAVIDRRRREHRTGSMADAADATVIAEESSSDERQVSACVRPLLAMLPAEDRAVLEQVEVAGKSQTELAAESNVPVSTIKSRVQRARGRLREHFERCCEIELDSLGNPREFSSRGSEKYASCSRCDESTSEGRMK